MLIFVEAMRADSHCLAAVFVMDKDKPLRSRRDTIKCCFVIIFVAAYF